MSFPFGCYSEHPFPNDRRDFFQASLCAGRDLSTEDLPTVKGKMDVGYNDCREKFVFQLYIFMFYHVLCLVQ